MVIFALWTDSDTVLHVVMFGYPVGIMLGPLLCFPFVSHQDQNSTANCKYPDCSNIETVYLISGATTFGIGVIFVIFHIFGMPTSNGLTRAKTLEWKESLSSSTCSPGDGRFGVTITVFLTCYYVINVAAIKASNSYYATYAVDANYTTEQGAAVLGFSKGASQTVSRLLVIPLVKHFSVYTLMFAYVFIQVPVALGLSLWGTSSAVAYWVFICMMPFVSGPIYPLGYNWASHFIILYAVVVGIADTGSFMVDALIGWIEGYMYTYVGMDSIFHLSVLFALLFCLYVVFINIVAHRHGTRFVESRGRLMEIFSVTLGHSESWAPAKCADDTC